MKYPCSRIRPQRRGFSLIELMLVVTLVGVLSALGVYGVQEYVGRVKTAEASEMLGRIAKDHLAAFSGESGGYEILSFGEAASGFRTLCPDASSRPVGVGSPSAPASTPEIRASKWQPGPSDFDDSGWQCLKFSVGTPLHYGYGMDTTQSGETASIGDGFVAYAIGDIDGDSDPSAFELEGLVQGASSQGVELVLATTIKQSDPE